MTRSPGSATRVVIGISGASGAIYGVRLLQRCREAGCETHLVASPAGVLNAHHELGLDRSALEGLADHCHNPADIGTTIASGSFAMWFCQSALACSRRSTPRRLLFRT